MTLTSKMVVVGSVASRKLLLIDECTFLFEQSSGQSLSKQSEERCVWNGICYSTTKNCAYDGPPKRLNDTGVEALKKWCSYMLPDNYAAGDNVTMCCDNAQVRLLLLL